MNEETSNKDIMNKIYLSYNLEDITDDIDFQILNENPDSGLEAEKNHLLNYDINVIDIDYKGYKIEIASEDKSKINDTLYHKIPFKIYDMGKILKSHNLNDHDYNTLDLKTKVILSYFRKKGIHYGNIKQTLIEFSCFHPDCMKTNNKSYIFKDSFHVQTNSKTDCVNNEHFKFYKEVQKELQLEYKQTINLDKKFIKWNLDYVLVEWIDENEKGEKEKFLKTLKEYFTLYKDTNKEDLPPIKSRKIIMCIENIKALLRHYEIEIKFNVITKEFTIYQFNELSRHNLDFYCTLIQDKFDLRCMKISREKLMKILLMIGLNKECNPFEDYLNEQYNNINFNIDDSEFKKFLSCIKTDSPNLEIKVKRFLLQIVNLALRNEHENDSKRAAFMLLLHGKQGSYKTSFCEFLLPEQLKSYFYEAKSVDVNNKDRIFENATKLIVELSEITSTWKKSDVESFKAYITAIYDLVRKPYDREHSKLKRRCCFIGTTNNHDWNKDQTGSRRQASLNNFQFDLEKAKSVDMNNVWSYIYHCYKKREIYWFNDKELEEIQAENSNYQYKNEEQIILDKYFNLKSNSSKGYKIKDCWNKIKNKLEPEEKAIFNSYMKLSKALTTYNANFKYDSKLKTKIYYIDFKPVDNVINADFKNENLPEL